MSIKYSNKIVKTKVSIVKYFKKLHYPHIATRGARPYWRLLPPQKAAPLRLVPTAPSVNGRGKALLTDGGVVFAEASVSQSNRFAGFFPLLPACCDARWPAFPLSSIVRARVASQCLNLHTRSDWMTEPLLPKKLNIFSTFWRWRTLQLNGRIHNALRVRPH